MDFSELAQIININSYTGNKAGVDENGDIFSNWMLDLGFKKRVFEREHIGNHLLFESQLVEGQKRILLLGHLDTVFAPGTFESFKEDNKWIYGPGVCDMKGGNVVALEALRKVSAEQGGITNIDMLLVSDEETGSEDSISLTQSIAKNYDYCFVFEAAGKNHEVVIARKGVGTFTIKLTGAAAHAGNHYSDGINANLAAAHMIIQLTQLTNLKLGTTVNAGKMSGGIGANTISPYAEIVVELRYTQSAERDRVLLAIKQLCETPMVEGVTADLSGGIQRDVMETSSAQMTLLAELARVLGYALKTEKRGGVSDANITSHCGVPTLDGFGPFGDGDHTVLERADKASFTLRINEMFKILKHYNCYSRS